MEWVGSWRRPTVLFRGYQASPIQRNPAAAARAGLYQRLSTRALSERQTSAPPPAADAR